MDRTAAGWLALGLLGGAALGAAPGLLTGGGVTDLEERVAALEAGSDAPEHARALRNRSRAGGNEAMAGAQAKGKRRRAREAQGRDLGDPNTEAPLGDEQVEAIRELVAEEREQADADRWSARREHAVERMQEQVDTMVDDLGLSKGVADGVRTLLDAYTEERMNGFMEARSGDASWSDVRAEMETRRAEVEVQLSDLGGPEVVEWLQDNGRWGSRSGRGM